MEIYDVVKKLIGEIEPVGESNTDSKRLENLKVHIDLVSKLIDDLRYAAGDKDSYEHSVGLIGKKAYSFLNDLREELEN